jgi:alpha,alpha-trehalase
MNMFIKKLKDRFDIVRSTIEPKAASPDELLGELFQDVQFRRVYPDCMTFVDMMPAAKLEQILKTYKLTRHDPDFDLVKFIQKHFKDYIVNEATYKTNPEHTVEQHIEALWKVLRRESPKSVGSVIGLPRPYIVAGGRFSAQYYWDTYFIMLGLGVSKHWSYVEDMTKNCAYMIRKLGFVANGNRTYFASRSQPPMFAQMVRLLASHKGKSVFMRYLPALVAEYKFWMKGAGEVSSGKKASLQRVVRMPDGELLNRYYDDKSTPRPESYKEDMETALQQVDHTPSRTYLDLRAAAESGWDFSSRWMANYSDLVTIETTHIVPADLNSLLVMLEETIADAYDVVRRPRTAKKYRELAKKRADAINKYLWDDAKKFYYDYNFVKGARTKVVSAAGLFPLYAKICTKEQAKAVARVTRHELLKRGGLLATNINTGQQWDAPNGWAPLQWIAIQGFRNYGCTEIAAEIKRRWMVTVNNVFHKEGKLVEKYNVVDTAMPAGGGEYLLQDGFGWTNGVMLALLHEDALNLS